MFYGPSTPARGYERVWLVNGRKLADFAQTQREGGDWGGDSTDWYHTGFCWWYWCVLRDAFYNNHFHIQQQQLIFWSSPIAISKWSWLACISWVIVPSSPISTTQLVRGNWFIEIIHFYCCVQYRNTKLPLYYIQYGYINMETGASMPFMLKMINH